MKRKIKYTTLSNRVRRNVNMALKFVQNNRGSYATLVLDLSDGDIWVDAFIDRSEFINYISKDIVILGYIYEDEEFEDCKNFIMQEAAYYFDMNRWEILY